MSSLPSKDPKPQLPKVGYRVRADGGLETLDGAQLELAESSAGNRFSATGEDARRLYADLAEVREQRLKRAGGTLYKRPGSPYWQMEYLLGGKRRQQSSHTRIKAEANALLRELVYRASAGTLPGTASFEQIIDALVADALVRGCKSNQPGIAARALKQRLQGCRAEDCDYTVWVKYANERREEAAADTVHLELSVAKRAYKLAHRIGLVSRVPEFPRIRNLHVRQGFADSRQWMHVRAKLRQLDFRDAADFAFLSGAREMEVLTLKWDDIERDARVIHLRVTKNGKPRAIPYGEWPELAAVIERRAAVREQLKRAAIITPWVFCFSEAIVIRCRKYHAAGDSLFKAAGGLPAMLRSEWSAACARAGLPGLLFHDLRRSAARNFERAGIARSVAMKLGGWTNHMYARYAIGADSEIAPSAPALSAYLKGAGYTSVTVGRKAQANQRESG